MSSSFSSPSPLTAGMGRLLILADASYPYSRIAKRIRFGARARSKACSFARLTDDAIYAPPPETVGFCDHSFIHREHNLNVERRNRSEAITTPRVALPPDLMSNES